MGCGLNLCNARLEMKLSQQTSEMPKAEVFAGKERRLRQRFWCDGPSEALTHDPECLFRGRVTNISASGCYIETHARLHVERSAKVNLRLNLNGKSYSTLARVMNVRPGTGLGLEFLFPAAEAEKNIQDLISMLGASASPQLGK